MNARRIAFATSIVLSAAMLVAVIFFPPAFRWITLGLVSCVVLCTLCATGFMAYIVLKRPEWSSAEQRWHAKWGIAISLIALPLFVMLYYELLLRLRWWGMREWVKYTLQGG